MSAAEKRDAWLLQRKQFVTASDVAALLGESPYKTRDQLRMEKLGLADEQPTEEHMEIALALEPAILEMARVRFGWDTHHNQDLHIDGTCPRLAATPDAWMETPYGTTLVQVKVTRSAAQEDCQPFTKGGKPSTAAFLNGAPLNYQLQVQAEMAVMGCKHAVVLALHTAPLKLRSYYVARHDGAIACIRSEVTKFWAEIEEGMAA